MLPSAATACAEMLALWFRAEFGWLRESFDMSFGIRAFLAVNFYVGHVARSSVGYEQNHIVDSCDSIALGGHTGYFYILK